jgi:putative ABC transport system permease protein
MKYFPLIWAGLWRKRARTILTLLSVAAAFLLFGILHGVTATFDDIIAQIGEERLRTMSRVNLLEPLPLAQLPQIESVPGVKDVAYYSIFFGYYREPDNGIDIGAISVERFFKAFPEVIVPEDQRAAMLRTRTGALVGKDLAEEHGWKIGDRVPLRSRRDTRKDGLEDWTFEIVGLYEFEDDVFPAEEFWIHHEYFDEARTFGNGTVNFYFEVIEDPNNAAVVSEAIDGLFVNSSDQTQTMSEKEWVRTQINQVGDIEFFVNAIIGAVMTTLLFLTGIIMWQSIRERIPELAVLKTYGFRDGTLITLVCIESLILCGAAAVVGLGLAATVLPSIFKTLGAPALPTPLTIIITGFVAAVVLAFISAATPVWLVRKLNVVDALAGR